MDRLTKKLKKGGYSANRHPEEALSERLEQLKGVHQTWKTQIGDMEEGMKEAMNAGPEGVLTFAMLMSAYNSIVRIGRRFEAACPTENNPDDTVTALGKLEDLYEQCAVEEADLIEAIEECRENGNTRDAAYEELMTTKFGVTQLLKQFDIATGYREESPDPHAYWPEEMKG